MVKRSGEPHGSGSGSPGMEKNGGAWGSGGAHSSPFLLFIWKSTYIISNPSEKKTVKCTVAILAREIKLPTHHTVPTVLVRGKSRTCTYRVPSSVLKEPTAAIIRPTAYRNPLINSRKAKLSAEVPKQRKTKIQAKL